MSKDMATWGINKDKGRAARIITVGVSMTIDQRRHVREQSDAEGKTMSSWLSDQLVKHGIIPVAKE